MALGFLGFLTRANQRSESLAIETRPAPGATEAPLSEQWALHASSPSQPDSGASEPPLATPTPSDSDSQPRPSGPGKPLGKESRKLRFIIRALLVATLAQNLFMGFGRHWVFPAVDRLARPGDYAVAEQAHRDMRAAGFLGGAVSFGSFEFSAVRDSALHAWDPQRYPDLGDGASASLARSTAFINLLPNACTVYMGSNQSTPMLSSSKADLQFTALHELSHCDDQQGDWAQFTPSAGELSAPQSRALRLMLLAETQASKKNPSLSAALSDTARSTTDPAQESWIKLGSKLFGEAAADARALLILSRLEPATWRATGWELWLSRAASDIGAIALLPHSHATEEAISIVLSASDESLSRLSPAGLSTLAAQAASDAVVTKLAKQGWHRRFTAELLPQAVRSSLAETQQIPADSPLWSEGDLATLARSHATLSADLAWAETPAGKGAFKSLLARMESLQISNQVTRRASHLIEGHQIQTALAPSAGSFDLRYEGSMSRSIESGILAQAALLQRAHREGSKHGFKTPSTNLWPSIDELRIAQKGLLNILLAEAIEQADESKPAYLGYNKRSKSYLLAGDPDEIARREAEGKLTPPSAEQPTLTSAARRPGKF